MSSPGMSCYFTDLYILILSTGCAAQISKRKGSTCDVPELEHGSFERSFAALLLFIKGMNRYEEHARLILKRCFEILDVVLIIFCLETRNFYHMVPQRMIGPRMAHSIQGRAKATQFFFFPFQPSLKWGKH